MARTVPIQLYRPQALHGEGALRLAAPPPLSLYVHLPWCLKKCPYCDFNSHEWSAGPQGAGIPEQRYIDALLADLQASLPLVWGRNVHTVFMGGGTPSLFSPAAIERLLNEIRALVKLVPDAEITLEANPGTFERDRFRAYRDAGVTRLSVGVQSFNDEHLKALGRVHDAAQAHAALDEAAQVFGTWNLDLMYALPGQDVAGLKQDLAQALAHQPPHLSVYHLTLEPNTYFAKYPPAIPDEDTAYDMLDVLTDTLGTVGLERYEVSAYARPGHRCQHNLNYWQFGDYLGLGAGAHGKLSFAHRVVRQVRWRDPQRYMEQALKGEACATETEVAATDLPFEFMLNALRLRGGFALSHYTERTGLPISSLTAALEEAEARGWLVQDVAAGRVVPTARGFDFLSDLQALFLPAE